MTLDCSSCGKQLEINEPSSPTPDGMIKVLCSHCGETIDVENPHGDEILHIVEDTWLRPVYATVEGAQARDGTGPITRPALVRYELAADGEDGAQFFVKGSAIQRGKAPTAMLVEVTP